VQTLFCQFLNAARSQTGRECFYRSGVTVAIDRNVQSMAGTECATKQKVAESLSEITESLRSDAIEAWYRWRSGQDELIRACRPSSAGRRRPVRGAERRLEFQRIGVIRAEVSPSEIQTLPICAHVHA
jgi:hypothetical protein